MRPASIVPVTLTRRGWSLVGAAVGLVVGSFLLGTVEMLILGVSAIALLAIVVWWLAARHTPDLAVRRRVKPDRLHVGSDGRIDLYVENTGVRAPGLGDARRVARRLAGWAGRRASRGRGEVTPGVTVLSPLALPPFGSRHP